ncbi:MAG: SgcJ/EcaC family oxidoreductase [Candidatus Aminicenantes bacterium]|nr:MAG: SgcJ/EcaC family oxidoreductase [Candidatus Aminicenantes bacterium]
MKKLFMILPFVFMLCFTFGCQKAEEVAEEVGVAPLSDEDVAAIKALTIPFDEAALAGDWNTLVAFFTEDAVLMGPNGPSIQGRSALMGMIESLGMTITEHKIDLVEVDGYGDIAYARGTYVETFSIEGVEEPVKDEGKILTILRKQSDGSWLFAIWMYNSDLSLPE